MLTAGVFSLSGCIENLEPAGISDLRGAKAELLRAQTALQAAEAAKVQAEAQLKLAEAKVKEAIAKQEEAKVAFVEAQAKKMEYEAETVKLENEYLTLTNDAERIKNEAARAELEQQIKRYEFEMQEAQNAAAKAAAELEVELTNIRASLAKAQAEYETALKEIELAKATLTDNQRTQLNTLQTAVERARAEVETKTVAFITAGQVLAEATSNADPEKGRELILRQVKRDLAVAKASYDASVEAEKLAEEMMKLDATIEGWAAKKDELEAQKVALKKQKTDKKAEFDLRRVDLDKTLGDLEDKADEYQSKTGYAYNDNTGLFSAIPGSPSAAFDLPEMFIPAPKDANDNWYASDFNLAVVVGTSYYYNETEAALKNIDNRLASYRNVAEGTYIKTQIESKERVLAKYIVSDAYVTRTAKYDDALAAYKSGDVLKYFQKWNVIPADTDVAGIVKDYNDALAAFEAALANYTAEVDKYVPVDIAEVIAGLESERDAAIAVAAAARAKAYQDAATAYDEAKLVYAKAKSTFENEKALYNIIWTDCEAEGDTYANMKAYMSTYEGLVAPTADETAKYNKYKALVAQMDRAQSAFDTATADFAIADTDHNKALTARNDARAAADKTYTRAENAAVLAYNNAKNEAVAGQPSFDPAYEANLTSKINDARTALDNAINDLGTIVKNKYVKYESTSEYNEDIEFVAAEGTSHEITMTFYNVPKFILDRTVNAGIVTYKMVAADLAKIKDLEYFKTEFLTGAADALVHMQRTVTGRAYNYNWSMNQTLSYYYEDDLTGDKHPMELLTFEQFKSQYLDEIKRNDADYREYVTNDLAGMGYPNLVEMSLSYSISGPLAYEYQLRVEIEELKASQETLVLLPDFIRAVEEARAEIVALFEANEKEMEALKAEVEAAAPALIEEREEMNVTLAALDAEIAVMEDKIDVYVGLINTYCFENSDHSATDKEEFEAYLKQEYEDAVDATINAGHAYVEAQKGLADAENELLDAVATAERKLKAAETELKEANDKLSRATAELQAALDVIYGTSAE